MENQQAARTNARLEGSLGAPIVPLNAGVLRGLFVAVFTCLCLLSNGGYKILGQEGKLVARGEPEAQVGETLKQAERLNLIVRNILDFYFKPPAHREVVIVCDREKEELAGALTAALKSRGHPAHTMLIGEDPESPASRLDDLFANDQVSLMVLASTRMWKDLRLAERLEFRDHWPSLRSQCSPVFFDAVIPMANMLRVYSADPMDTLRFLVSVQQQLAKYSRVRIVAPGGTNIEFVPRRWEIWGWEILTYPVENSVNGTIVADAGVFFSKVKAPLTLTIREGKLVRVECPDPEDDVFKQYVHWMNEAHETDPLNWQIAEVGIGGSANARISDILMETEAVRGTNHFCFGDNSVYGGEHKTSWHGGTVVVNNPR